MTLRAKLDYIAFIWTYVLPEMSTKKRPSTLYSLFTSKLALASVLSLFDFLTFAFLWPGSPAAIVDPRWGE